MLDFNRPKHMEAPLEYFNSYQMMKSILIKNLTMKHVKNSKYLLDVCAFDSSLSTHSSISFPVLCSKNALDNAHNITFYCLNRWSY